MNPADLQRKEADKYFQDGLHKLKQNHYQAALAAFDRTIQLAPQYPEPWMFRGAVKINHLNDALGGIADCDAAIRFLPNNPMAHANRGIACLRLERYNEAARDFGVALQHSPLDGNLHRMKGYSHYKLEEYELAVFHYSACIRFWHDQALCYDMRGVCYFCLHEFDKALDDFNESIWLNGNRASAYTNRGIVHTRHGDYDRAMEDHNAALKLQQEAWYYSNRGLVYLLQGQTDQAEADCKTALDMDKKLADAWGLRGQIHFLQGNLPEALSDFDLMARYKEPDDGHALAAKCVVYQAMGQSHKAADIWRTLVALDADYGNIRWLEDEFMLAAPLMTEVYKIVAAL